MRKIARFFVVATLMAAAAAELPAQEGDAAAANREANVQAYIDLMRADVRTQKVKVLSAVMQFTPDEASIFWPVYKMYDAELKVLGDKRLELIRDYAQNYNHLSDEKADEIARRALDFEAERYEVKRKYYEVMKIKMGGKTAARFIQVENQLLHLIDLQIASVLPAIE